MNYLILVNKQNIIKDKYFKTVELVDYYDILDNKIQIEKETLESYLELKKFLLTKQIEIGIDSSYRSLNQQQEIIDKAMTLYGKDYVDKYIALAGTSEHHTGLAIDLSIKVNDTFIIENEQLMANEQTYLEIHKHLRDFGFILRYPKNKEKVTGYYYEPWHIRYVGKIAAKIISENELTLEEYLTKFSGVLVVNKPKNMTSFAVVNEVRKILGIKRIGHTGTLDPLAEGVLVLTIGKATKIGQLLTSYEKEYIAGVKIGILTDTLDITGKVIATKEINNNLNYQEICKSFQKKYLQEVPIYSAVKVNGKKLYQYARNNIEVDLPKKEVEIKRIELLSSNNNSFKFKTLVSKGTYIRSLIKDMGTSVNQYFCMDSLIRTMQGHFSLKDAYSLEDIKNNKFKIIYLEEVLSKYPNLVVDNKELLKKILNGVKLKNIYGIENILIWIYNQKVIAIYKNDNNYLIPWIVFS